VDICQRPQRLPELECASQRIDKENSQTSPLFPSALRGASTGVFQHSLTWRCAPCRVVAVDHNPRPRCAKPRFALQRISNSGIAKDIRSLLLAIELRSYS
jgi:hypothetical protein